MEKALSDTVKTLTTCVNDMDHCLEVSKMSTASSTTLARTMLQSKRVFQLVSEYDVQRARLDLMEDIEPLLQKLYGKLEKSLNKLERETLTLQQTFELNKLRLNNQETSPLADSSKSDLVVMASSTQEELECLKQLKSRKEELIRKIELLQTEASIST